MELDAERVAHEAPSRLDARPRFGIGPRELGPQRIVDVATAARLKSCDVKLFDDLSNVFAPRTQGDS